MDEFISQLLDAQGIPADLDPEVRQQVFDDAKSMAINLINRRIIDAMPSEAVTEFNKLLDQPDVEPEQLQTFIEQRVPDRERVTAEALLEFRSLYLGEQAN